MINQFMTYADFSDAKIKRYSTVSHKAVLAYLSELPESYFQYVNVHENTSVEKLSYDYYGSADFYEIILLLNSREIANERFFSEDVIEAEASQNFEEYRDRFYGDSYNVKNTSIFEDLRNIEYSKLSSQNLKRKFVKLIRKDIIYVVRHEIRKLIDENQENIELTDLTAEIQK